MTKTIWITRTQPAAQESAKAWRVAGFEPLVLPLLDVHSIDHDVLPEDVVVLFTSKNGVTHFNGSAQRAICVGDATAEKARAAGYRDVVSVDGTSADVTDWVRRNIKPSQAVCHVSGWHVRGQITEDLRDSGYDASRLKVYRSFPVEVWPQGDVDSVVLYSPLAAQTFAKNASGKDVATLSVLCLSAAVAQELDGLTVQCIEIADLPREESLIRMTHSGPCGSG